MTITGELLRGRERAAGRPGAFRGIYRQADLEGVARLVARQLGSAAILRPVGNLVVHSGGTFVTARVSIEPRRFVYDLVSAAVCDRLPACCVTASEEMEGGVDTWSAGGRDTGVVVLA